MQSIERIKTAKVELFNLNFEYRPLNGKYHVKSNQIKSTTQ